MPIGSCSRCASIFGAATLLLFFVSAGPVRPPLQDAKAPPGQSGPAQQQQPPQAGTPPGQSGPARQGQGHQTDAFEILPYPPDLAPGAKEDRKLAGCIQIDAWADKAEFKQVDPVVIHYKYKNVSKQDVIISGIPEGMHSLDVEVASANDLMPRTRYGTLRRTVRGIRFGRDGRGEVMLHPLIESFDPGPYPPNQVYGNPEPVKGTIVANLLRDMSNPGRYRIELVLPVYNRDFTAKAKARSSTIFVRVLDPPEY
jgi:hypothetical protein